MGHGSVSPLEHSHPVKEIGQRDQMSDQKTLQTFEEKVFQFKHFESYIPYKLAACNVGDTWIFNGDVPAVGHPQHV